jgi:hypothetical protein
VVAVVSTALITLVAAVIVALLVMIAWASGRPLFAEAGRQQIKAGEVRAERSAGMSQEGRAPAPARVRHEGGPR